MLNPSAVKNGYNHFEICYHWLPRMGILQGGKNKHSKLKPIQVRIHCHLVRTTSTTTRNVLFHEAIFFVQFSAWCMFLRISVWIMEIRQVIYEKYKFLYNIFEGFSLFGGEITLYGNHPEIQICSKRVQWTISRVHNWTATSSSQI